jgi:hypothetical protein
MDEGREYNVVIVPKECDEQQGRDGCQKGTGREKVSMR